MVCRSGKHLQAAWSLGPRGVTLSLTEIPGKSLLSPSLGLPIY